jgi:hypothetical protein
VSEVPNMVALRFDNGSSSSGSGGFSSIDVYICSHVDILMNVYLDTKASAGAVLEDAEL